MGNQSKDENATTSTDARDQDQESRDATLARIVAEAVAQQTKSIVDAFSKQKQKKHNHSQKHSKGKWTRHMHSMKRF